MNSPAKRDDSKGLVDKFTDRILTAGGTSMMAPGALCAISTLLISISGIVPAHLQGWFQFPMIGLFLLGALQGAVGWIMVASGLVGDAIYVKPTRLALHFVFAIVLLFYTFWFALKLLVKDRSLVAAPQLKRRKATLKSNRHTHTRAATQAGIRASCLESLHPRDSEQRREAEGRHRHPPVLDEVQHALAQRLVLLHGEAQMHQHRACSQARQPATRRKWVHESPRMGQAKRVPSICMSCLRA